jgi:hypothetical protein
VYLWDLENEAGGFAACFLIKKEIIEAQRRVSAGNWDSIHVVEITPKPKDKKAAYKVTSTVMLTMTTEKGNAGTVLLSGSLTRQGKEKVMDCASDVGCPRTRGPATGLTRAPGPGRPCDQHGQDHRGA